MRTRVLLYTVNKRISAEIQFETQILDSVLNLEKCEDDAMGCYTASTACAFHA